jgi:hypothetical protein
MGFAIGISAWPTYGLLLGAVFSVPMAFGAMLASRIS